MPRSVDTCWQEVTLVSCMHAGGRCHSPSCEKHKRCEGAMFHIMDMLFISFFQILIMSVCGGDGGPAIALCKWVKNPEVKKMHIAPCPPQNPAHVCPDVHPQCWMFFLVSPPLWAAVWFDFHCCRPQSVIAPPEL